MRKADLDALAEDDAPPPDDSVLNAKGVNGHGCRPCPFCLATSVHAKPIEITSGAKPDFAVRCTACDATGPWGLTPKIATTLWNEGFDNVRPATGRRTRPGKTENK
jgi:hypothetical protein